jgi:glutamate synthase domain-containing protein 2
LQEGLILARDLSVDANLRDKTKLIASGGRVTSGFCVACNFSLGADVTNFARDFMMSIGYILQSLKCSSYKCPTGITTQNKDLMFDLGKIFPVLMTYIL